MKYPITQHLKCLVDSNINERKGQTPHCHIIKDGEPIAIVVLEPYTEIIEDLGLDKNEVNEVYIYCERNKYSLLKEYQIGMK